MTNEKIGQRIKQIRCAKGLSQEELARRVDLSRTAITKIESGSQDVRFLELEKLAEALGISLGYLVEERRAVRESPDNEFFRVSESAAPYPACVDNKLRAMLLVILERCAGNPGINTQSLGTIVRQADQAYLQTYGETISGIPFISTNLQKIIDEALAVMTSTEELMRIENKDTHRARYLPLVKAELRQLNAAEYIFIENAICRTIVIGKQE
ncbi:MAG: helix-turn-helix transcriptional regulator [Chlorobium sp.]|jgi:transcriptional regulator with XRE-family HTH domain